MSAPAIADPAAGYCAFLRAAIGDMLAPATLPSGAGTVPAVFRPDLPSWYDASMPAACVVVRPAGGHTQFGSSMLYIADPRVDVVCYGADQQQATALCVSVTVASKRLVSEVWDGVLIYAANIAGGPIPLPDEKTLWPACWCSVQLVHGELPQP